MTVMRYLSLGAASSSSTTSWRRSWSWSASASPRRDVRRCCRDPNNREHARRRATNARGLSPASTTPPVFGATGQRGQQPSRWSKRNAPKPPSSLSRRGRRAASRSTTKSTPYLFNTRVGFYARSAPSQLFVRAKGEDQSKGFPKEVTKKEVGKCLARLCRLWRVLLMTNDAEI